MPLQNGLKLSMWPVTGTFPDYVLVSWNGIPNASTYVVYRSDTAGPLGDPISAPISGTEFRDETAEPGVHYFYTVISNTGVISNQDEGWRPGGNVCPEGEECIHEGLDPFACASANGFLNQVNIASVINSSSETLSFLVEYRDLFGITKGAVRTVIEPLQKKDFIVNDMGLVPDLYGTVCVTVIDRDEKGLWRGGVTLYKADERDGEGSFGGRNDFALYYPFTNPRTGSFTQPLNTFHLGVPADATIANWIRITDAEPGDGERLRGVLNYFNENGEIVHTDIVDLPDGGRFDFSGHEGIAGIENVDAVGMAHFVPEAKTDGTAAKYYISLGRYFYDCFGATCNNFYTAFIVPFRPAATIATNGGASTIDGELSVIELNNLGETATSTDISIFAESGSSAGEHTMSVPALGTRHEIVNKVGETGFLTNDTVGAATVVPTDGAISAVSVFYKLDEKGTLQYAYSAPLVQSPGVVQMSEFNSFLEQESSSEVYNPTDETVSAQITARDADNIVVFTMDIELPARTTRRIPLALPKDTIGTLTLQSDSDALVFRNYVKRGDEYVLPFSGQ